MRKFCGETGKRLWKPVERLWNHFCTQAILSLQTQMNPRLLLATPQPFTRFCTQANSANQQIQPTVFTHNPQDLQLTITKEK